MVNRVNDSIASFDKEGNITFTNRSFENFIRLKTSDVVGKKIWRLLPEHAAAAIFANVKEAMEKEEVKSFELKVNDLFYAFTIFPSLDGVTLIGGDISDLKKAQEALNESEQLKATLFDNSDDGFILLEPKYDEKGEVCDFVFLKVNPAYERQTGRKAVVVVGKKLKEIEPDIEAHWISAVGKVVQSGKSIHLENYNKRTQKWYVAHYFPLIDGKVGIFFRDITEHKKAEQILAKKQQELNCILDSTPTIIFYKDKDGKVIQANRAFGEALKVPKESLLGKTVFDLYSAEIAQGMTNDDITVMASRLPKLGIVEPYESPAGLRWIKTDKFPSIDENDDVTGIIGFSEDITDRKKAEEALLESEIKYKQLVDKLPEMVFEIDTQGHVTFANSRAIEVLGYSKEELEGDFGATLLVAAQDIERSRANIKNMFSGNMRHSGEYFFVRKDGTRFPVLLTSAPMVKDNMVVGARGIAVDLTERKEMEKKLKENERLAAIGATAGMVGHDIRNPLQAIVSDIYLLRDEINSLPECKIKNGVLESVDDIERNVSYINKIVVDLQDYARALNPEFKEADLCEIFTNVLDTIQVPNSIRVIVSVEKCGKIQTDSEFLRRALTNLVTNAIQAMPHGGELRLESVKRDNKVFITVSDTGVGIPEEIKPKLFTPMLTTKAKGQGFGLAVVKRLVEALNGSITFESKRGIGTKFTICLQKQN
ncbi:MAG: PAS domain S-box protein [Candidatus Bathyarchaeota archaeon]|nr:PAS domain S-box protein [Candidatus Bathyarchaeota archaeon]